MLDCTKPFGELTVGEVATCAGQAWDGFSKEALNVVGSFVKAPLDMPVATAVGVTLAVLFGWFAIIAFWSIMLGLGRLAGVAARFTHRLAGGRNTAAKSDQPAPPAI